MKKLNDNLEKIQEELDVFSKKSSYDIFEESVNEKLQANLSQYFGFLNINSRHLDTKPNRRIIKAVNKLQKNADKNYLREHSDISN